MRASVMLVAFSVSGLLSLPLTAQVQRSQKPYGDEPARTAIQDMYATFLINNILSYYSNNGDGSYNWFATKSGFEYPKGSGKTAIFEDGIVWGGFHKEYQPASGHKQPKVGGSVYRHALQPGRILVPGGPTDSEHPLADDPAKPEYRVYRVRPDVSPTTSFADALDALEVEAALINRFEDETTARSVYDAYVKDWNEWPARNATDPAGLAPFTDLNENGTYEPDVDTPGEPGASQTLYYVSNDLDSTLTAYLAGCPPFGLEVHRIFWGYTNPGPLSNAIFSRTSIINKSGAPVDSMFLVQWSDPDVGDAGDDFTGCDTTRDIGYAYNGYPLDGIYGFPVPAVGYTLLQGPIVPSPGDSALFQGAYRHNCRNLGMSAFVFFGEPCCYTDPVQGPDGNIQWYRIMNGLTPAAGNEYIDPLTGQPTKFCLSGNPLTGEGWVDGMAGLTPKDRRLCLVTGPFNLANGDTQELVVATVAGQGDDRLSSIGMLKQHSDLIWSAYPSLLRSAPPICAVEVAYPSGDSARVTIKVDGGREELQTVLGNLKDSSGTVIASFALFDDGIHGDSVSADNVFTNQTMVRKALRPLALDLDVTSSTGGTNRWPRFLPAITVAGPVTITGPIIFSDHINSDGEPNPGENIRFGVSTHNATAFPLRLQLVSTVGKHIIPSLSPGEIDHMAYLPQEPRSFFAADLPVSPLDSMYAVPFNIYDTVGNAWSTSLTIRLVPLRDTIKSALMSHPSGSAAGSWNVSIVRKDQVRDHLYVIQGVDSVDSLGRIGFTLRDSTDGRILLLNHPLPDPLGHDTPITDGFKVLLGSIDTRYGYRRHEIPHGTCVWSWVNGDRGAEGFGGAIGVGYDNWYSSSTITRREASSVLIRFAETDQDGNLLTTDDSLISYAYRYLRGATQPPARPEFAPFIVNPGGGYACQDYVRNLPFAAYDIGKNPPVRLMVGYMENNMISGMVDGKYWPPHMGDSIGNIIGSGPREFFFIFAMPYSTTPSETLQVDLLNTTVPFMWMGSVTRAVASFHTGDEFVIRAYHPPTSRDTWTFNPRFVVGVEERSMSVWFELAQNYPNPFNPKTEIRSHMPEASHVKLVVYDILGREVVVLVNEKRAAGTYQDTFDAAGLASGVYFFRLTAGSFVTTKKMLLIR